MTFGQLLEKYSDRQGYTKVEITQAMLNLVKLGSGDASSESLLGAVGGITGISILTASWQDDDFVADMKKVPEKGSGYKLLTSITGDGQSTMFYYREIPNSARGDEPARISEFMLIMYGPEDNLIIRVDGDFSIRQISSIVDKAATSGKIDVGL